MVATHTAVDVQWQDGSIGRAVPAVGLVPVPHRNDLTYDYGTRTRMLWSLGMAFLAHTSYFCLPR